MNVTQRIDAFDKLGKKLKKDIETKNATLQGTIKLAEQKNPWFIKTHVLSALQGIVKMLDGIQLGQWLNAYPAINLTRTPRTIGMVLAGNIPAVGFHDILCCLITGHTVCLKPSSKDEVLIKYLINELIHIEKKFASSIIIVERLKNFDAVIATGSDNSSRYFEYYFAKYPHIIRKNRTAVAVLTGNETNKELEELGNDIFLYFGLGCRNVSKIYLPEGYNLKTLFEPIEKFNYIINHNKYANNYNYNRSIYLINMIKHHDNGFLLIKEDTGFHSPLAVNYIEYYNNTNMVAKTLEANANTLQCIVSNLAVFHMPSIPFGKAQYPDVWDYADNVDTITFLLGLQ